MLSFPPRLLTTQIEGPALRTTDRETGLLHREWLSADSRLGILDLPPLRSLCSMMLSIFFRASMG